MYYDNSNAASEHTRKYPYGNYQHVKHYSYIFDIKSDTPHNMLVTNM